MVSWNSWPLWSSLWQARLVLYNRSEWPPPVAPPDEFTWYDKDGVNRCTESFNQHISQYCWFRWADGPVPGPCRSNRDRLWREGTSTSTHQCSTWGTVAVWEVVTVALWTARTGGCNVSLPQKLAPVTRWVQPCMGYSSKSREGFRANADCTCLLLNVARTCCSLNPADGIGVADVELTLMSEEGV